MDKYALGIDFGMCNIKVSNYDKIRGKTIGLKIDKNDNDPDKKVPNIIKYFSRDRYAVGMRAKKDKNVENDTIIAHMKRKLEFADWSYCSKENGFVLTAEEVVQDIFRWIKKSVEGLGKEIEEAVITVPVSFSEIQKNKIILSAKKAKIPVVEVLTEPVAALFSIEELFDEECEENIVIFDFGGATLDLCLFHIENDGDGEIFIEIEASCGLSFGGVDITNILYEKIIYPKYKKMIDAELSSKDKAYLVKQELYDSVERMKQEMFEEEEVKVEEVYTSPIDGRIYEFEVELEEIIKEFKAVNINQRVLEVLDELFDDTNYDKEDVTQVKVFGGTSRVHYFRELLQEYFGSDVFDIDEYDSENAYRAVADGAARYLGIRNNPDGNIRFVNSIPFCIGMDVKGKFKPLVKRNQKYGVMSPYKNIKYEELEKICWKIPLYQSFRSETVEIKGENGAVYMGSIELKKELYQDAEGVLFKFGVNKIGKIVGQFFTTDSNNIITMIEEKEIMIGV